MKTDDTFHWLIYICCRLCKIRYYSFHHRRRFVNFVFVMSARTDMQYYSSFFFFFFFFFSRAWPVGKHISLLPARPAGKIPSDLPASLKKSCVICRPGSVQTPTTHKYNETRFSFFQC